MSVQLASAYVQIIPSMRGAQKTIATELEGASEKTGKSAGTSIGTGILGSLRGFAAPIAAIVGSLVGVEAIKQSAETFESTAASTRLLQRQIGGTSQQVSTFIGAMQLSGVTVDQSQVGLRTLSKNIGLAGQSSKTAAKFQDLLGFSLVDAAGNAKPMAELLPQLADRFQQLPDGPQKTAIAMQLFGRSGTALIPFLDKGSAGLAQLSDQAKRSGLVIDDVAMNTFVAARTSARNFSIAMQGAGTAVGGNVVPVLDAFANVGRAAVIPVLNLIAQAATTFRPAFLGIGEAGEEVADAIGKALPQVLSTVFGGFASGGETAARVGEVIASAGKSIASGIEAFTDGFVHGTDAIGSNQSVLASWGAVAYTIFEHVRAAVTTVTGFFSRIGPSLAPAIPIIGGVGVVLAGMHLETVIASGERALSGLVELLGPFGKLLEPMIGSLAKLGGGLEFLGGPVGFVIGLLTTAYATSAQFRAGINQIIGIVVNLATSILGQLVPVFTSLVSAILPVVTAIAGQLLPAFTSIAVSILPALTSILQVVSTVITSVLAAVLPLVTALVGALVPVLIQIVNAVLPPLISVFQQVIAAILPLVTTIISALLPVFAQIIAAITPLISALVSVLIPVIQSLLPIITAVFAAIVPIIQGALQIVTGVLQVFAGLLTGNWNMVWTGFNNIVVGVWNTVVAIIQGAIGIIVAIFGPFVTFLVGLWQSAWARVSAVISAVWAFILGFINGAINTVRTIITTGLAVIVTAFNIYVNLWRTVITTVWNAIVSFVTGAISNVRTVISTGLSIIATAFTTYVNLWRTVITTAWNAIVSLVTGAINTVRSVISSGLNAAASVVSSVFSSVRSVVSSTWNTVVSTISGAVGRVVSTVTGLGPKILSTITGIGSQLYSAGKTMIQNLINGITSMIGAVGSAIGSVTSKIAAFLPHSPAKEGVFAGSGWRGVFNSGHAIAAHVADGLRDGSDDIDLAFSGLTGSLNPGTVSATANLHRDVAAPGVGNSTTINYYAQPNESLDSREALQTAMRRTSFLKPST